MIASPNVLFRIICWDSLIFAAVALFTSQDWLISGVGFNEQQDDI